MYVQTCVVLCTVWWTKCVIIHLIIATWWVGTTVHPIFWMRAAGASAEQLAPCRSQVLRRNLWVRSLTQASNFEDGGLLPNAAFLHTSDSLACLQGHQITWFHPFISMFRSPLCWKFFCTSSLNLLCFRLSSALCNNQIKLWNLWHCFGKPSPLGFFFLPPLSFTSF